MLECVGKWDLAKSIVESATNVSLHDAYHWSLLIWQILEESLIKLQKNSGL